jgi:heterodisulfide reductase subunit C
VLRKVSQETGYFRDSEMGRQQTQLMNAIGTNILDIGYCVHPDRVDPDYHIEQGPVWRWYVENIEEVSPKLGANYHGDGPGALRTIPHEDMAEVHKIFEVTGGFELRKKVR